MTLLKLTLIKEKIHWTRTKQMFSLMEGIGGKYVAFPIIVLIVSISHYAFAFMHFAFESYLYFGNKNQFLKNLKNMSHKSTNLLLQLSS